MKKILTMLALSTVLAAPSVMAESGFYVRGYGGMDLVRDKKEESHSLNTDSLWQNDGFATAGLINNEVVQYDDAFYNEYGNDYFDYNQVMPVMTSMFPGLTGDSHSRQRSKEYDALAGFAVGYQWGMSRSLTMALELDYTRTFKPSNEARDRLMLNTRLGLADGVVPLVNPYVMVGLGGQFCMWGASGEEVDSLAWSAGAGVEVPINDMFAVDVGARYVGFDADYENTGNAEILAGLKIKF